MMADELLNAQDLITAKKHDTFHSEVITGKTGGVAGGANIDYATNAATGQVQKTMPAILRDIGFEPASFDFTTGGTLGVNDRNKAVLWPLAGGGDGDWYNWEGVLPKVVPAASTPYTTGGVADGAWRPVGDITLRGDLSSASDNYGDALLAVLQPYTGAVPRTQHDKNSDVIHVRDFGAVGNDTDETIKLQQAAAAAAGRTLVFESNKIYRLTEELAMSTGTTFDLKNSTLRFACVGAKRNLAVGSNCQVINGTVENVVGTTGLEGTYQTPITVGRYTTLAGVSNVLLQNLTISTVLPQGNGIAIFGDSHNITVQNIKFPSSAFIGIPIMLHWSFDGGPTGPYLGTTTHPHNVTIDNIWCGDLTYNGGPNALGVSAIFISASRNVSVSNVYVNSFPHGKIVTVYAGDFGWQFATPIEQVMGSTGIRINGIAGRALVGLHVYNKNPLEAIKKVWPGEIRMDDACVFGFGQTDTGSRGLQIEVSDNVRVSRCVFDSFYNGVFLGTDATNLQMTNSYVRNSYAAGFESTFGTGMGSITLQENVFSGSNKASLANIADVKLANINGVMLKGNNFSSPQATWSVKAENTTTRLRMLDNHVSFVSAAGPAFSLGAQSDANICIQYDGNTSATTPSGGVRGGQFIIPAIFSTKHGQSTELRLAYYNTVPDRGTWAVGDRVFHSNPVVGQPKGWVCTVAGTPGTWVSEGVL